MSQHSFVSPLMDTIANGSSWLFCKFATTGLIQRSGRKKKSDADGMLYCNISVRKLMMMFLLMLFYTPLLGTVWWG